MRRTMANHNGIGTSSGNRAGSVRPWVLGLPVVLAAGGLPCPRRT